MKKFLPTFVLLLVLGAGGAALYLFQRQGQRGGLAAAAVAEYLPADTQLLLSIPDLDGTLADWKTTDLYKIWAEPEMQNFLAKPLSKLPPHQEFDDIMAKIVRLSPTHLFVALTAGDEEANRPHVVAGFDFKGDKAEVDKLLSGARESLRRRYPAGKADLVEYQGHALETFDGGDGYVFASTYLDRRYLLASDLALLKATIDRCDHRAPAAGAGTTLEKDGDFQTVLAKLPAEHATLIFARPRASLNRLLDLATAAGQPVEESKRAELEKVKAIGATTRIEKGKLRDTLYYLAPGLKPEVAKLDMNSLPLTSANTLIYAAATLDLPAQIDLPDGPLPPGTPASGLLVGFQELAVMLHGQGVTLERFRAAFGNEFSLHLDWPPDRTQPALIVSVDVRERVEAGKVVDDLTKALSASAEWQTTQAGGLTFHAFSGAKGAFVSPTFTLTDKHLVFGLNPQEVRDAARREQAGEANFTGTDAYRKTVEAVPAPNASFMYIDSPAFFERLYGTLRGLAMFSALFYPNLGEYIDVTKLPATKTISQHLSPTVFTQKTDDQGSLLESVGSVTVGQAGFALVSGAAAVGYPLIQSQLGPMGKGAGAALPAGPEPTLSPTIAPPARASQPGGDE